jgi:hypothetical protein
VRHLNSILVLILFSNNLLSRQDLDIDGVYDNVDRCLNTPFDELVDRDGCSKSQKPSLNYGDFTIKVGSDFFIDSEYEDDNSLTLYADYRYNSWDISISNSRLITNSVYTQDNSYSDNDIYISLGKGLNLNGTLIKFSIGTKIAGDIDGKRLQRYAEDKRNLEKYSENGQNIDKNRDNDYFSSLNCDYLLNERQTLFLYYGYTLSGDSKKVDYANYSSFSVGTGYMLTPDWYGAISYDYIGSIYRHGEASENITLFGNYTFTKHIFASIGYSYALDEVSYENIFSLALGFSL